MRRRNLIQLVAAALAGLLPSTTRAQETDELSRRPSSWRCPFCQGEFKANVLYANHRSVKFYTPEGEHQTCAYAVGKYITGQVPSRLVKKVS